MDINDLLKERNWSMYKLSARSEVPYTTINDLCNYRTSIERCSGETIYRLAKTLNVSMEDLLSEAMEKRLPFMSFKSNVCHLVKSKGDLPFIIEVIKSNDIRKYFNRRWHLESLYLLGMIDYLCRMNDLPLNKDYDDLRDYRIDETVYPSGILLKSILFKDDMYKIQAYNDSIPEFRRFNIVENEVRNVV